MGGDWKLIYFHLKIYAILFNSFCAFLLEQTDVFGMFLLLPTIKKKKKKKIIENKTEDRQSVTSLQLKRDLTNPWKLFKPNKPTTHLSFWEFKILRWFAIIDYTLQNRLQDHTLHLASFFTTSYLVCPYYNYSIADAKCFSPGTLLPLLYTAVKTNC